MKHIIGLMAILSPLSSIAQEIVTDSTRAETASTLDKVQELKEVTVKAYRPVSKVTREGFAYTVKGTPLAQSGTLNEVLEQMPMVKKSTEGYEVVGKGAAVFYLNGHRVYNLSELDNITSKDVKNVEVITSPGAQYDASVKAVIKITTAKNTLEGLTVNARSTWYQNRHSSWTEQLDLRYNKNRWTVYDNIKYQSDRDLTWKDLTQTVHADTLWKEISAEKEYRKSRTLENVFGVDFRLSEGNYIGGRYTLTYLFRNAMDLEASNNVAANNEAYDLLTTTGTESTDKYPQHLVNLYYSGSVKGYTLNADADYLYSNASTGTIYREVSQTEEDRTIDAVSAVKNRMLSLRGSVGHKLFGGDAVVGLEYRYTKRNDDYTEEGQYIPSSVSLLKETQYAPFIDYSVLTKVGLFGLGVRLESTRFKYYADGEYVPEQSQTTTKLFPKFSWGIRVGRLQAQLAYSTSINRPTYRQLSSNTLYGSRYTWQTGNPLLRPEYTHELALQGVYRFLQFQAAYSDARDAIINWGTQQTSNTAVAIMSYKNLPSVKQLRLAMVLSQPFGIWTPQLTLAMNKQFLHLSTEMGMVNLNAPIWFAKLSNSVKLSPTFTLFLTANYQSTGDYRNVHLSRHVWSMNFNATKSFCRDRFSVQLKVNDIFNTQKDGNVVYNERMVMKLLNRYDSRAVSLTLRYNFNDKDYKRHSHSTVDGELKRF